LFLLFTNGNCVVISSSQGFESKIYQPNGKPGEEG
jgi:hypothetical protein